MTKEEERDVAVSALLEIVNRPADSCDDAQDMIDIADKALTRVGE